MFNSMCSDIGKARRIENAPPTSAPASVVARKESNVAIINLVCYTCNTVQDIEIFTLSSEGFTLMCPNPDCKTAFRFEPVKAESVVSKLSPKQKKIVEYLAKGFSVKEISNILGVQIGTVKAKVRWIKKIIGAKSAAHCVSIAIALGEISITSALETPLNQHPNGETVLKLKNKGL